MTAVTFLLFFIDYFFFGYADGSAFYSTPNVSESNKRLLISSSLNFSDTACNLPNRF